ncbi:MAG TPA: Rne/Rng family ribonuclease [Clostridia bacterium]|nr:Rne/Rng family ribonuclease [Clostridia bacterium]
MKREIFVDINPYQTRVVLAEDGAPSEVYIERRGRERLVGNIYKGKVQNVLPGMQAAFVDIGLERNAFLYAGDIQTDKSEFTFNGETPLIPNGIPNIRDIVKVGQEIMVQIVKEPVGTKGARVTTNITLPGRTLVLMPSVDYIGVSRRIEDEAERMRLKATFERVAGRGAMGAIVRTAAIGKSDAEFEADYVFLSRLWERILQKSNMVSAPRLLHAEEPLVFRTIRDIFTPDIGRLVINDREFFDRVQIVAGIISPVLRDKVELYDKIPDMFDALGLDDAIRKALGRKVWMKNGGYIIIDQTEALTTIDVNTGKYVGTDNLQETITETNCEAAREIAHQLRLRDISGIIIVDFIDMDEIADKERVLATLRTELAKDRTKSNVLGITQLGLVEMTRKKTRQCISNTLQSPCPYCGGDGKVLSGETMLLRVRRRLMRDINTDTAKHYLVRVHPVVAAAIEENTSSRSGILPIPENGAVYVKPEKDMHIEEFEVRALATRDEVIQAAASCREYS